MYYISEGNMIIQRNLYIILETWQQSNIKETVKKRRTFCQELLSLNSDHAKGNQTS